jgi:hypothetical protein
MAALILQALFLMRQGASNIYAHALGAAERGDQDVAMVQARLAVLCAGCDEEQRSEVEQLSGRIEEGDAEHEDGLRYLSMQDQIDHFESDDASDLLRRSDGQEHMDNFVSGLEAERARIASGQITTGEEIQEERLRISKEMGEDAAFETNVERAVASLIEENPGMDRDRALDKIAEGRIRQRQQEQTRLLISSGNLFLEQLGSTRQADFRSDLSAIHGRSIEAILDGDNRTAVIHRQTAGAYFDLGHSSVTEARERGIVLDASERLSSGEIDLETASSIIGIQQLRAEHETALGDAGRTAELRNARAYFDLAILSANGRSRDRTEAIRETAVAYSSWAATDPTDLTDSQREQRTDAMEFA